MLKAALGKNGCFAFVLASVAGNCLTMFIDPVASRLLQVKMNIMPHETCHSLRETAINDTVHLCVGTVPTEDMGICKVSSIVESVRLNAIRTKTFCF